METFVLVHKGKAESIDYVKLKKFDSEEAANAFVAENTDLEDKYYTCCSIIKLDTIYNICRNGFGQTAKLEEEYYPVSNSVNNSDCMHPVEEIYLAGNSEYDLMMQESNANSMKLF